MLCECAQLDWTGRDMTAEHHPECPKRYRTVILIGGLPAETTPGTSVVFNGTSSCLTIADPSLMK